MIRHVAVFRFTPGFSTEQREHWMSLLRAMPDHVSGLRSMTVGVDLRGGEASHDLAIVADFDDLDSLDAYNIHPAHAEILRISAPVKTSVAIVDFAIADGS